MSMPMLAEAELPPTEAQLKALSDLTDTASKDIVGLPPDEAVAVLDARLFFIEAENEALQGRVEELESDHEEMMGQINGLIELVNKHSRFLMTLPQEVAQTSEKIQANTDLLTKMMDTLPDGDEWKAGDEWKNDSPNGDDD